MTSRRWKLCTWRDGRPFGEKGVKRGPLEAAVTHALQCHQECLQAIHHNYLHCTHTSHSIFNAYSSTRFLPWWLHKVVQGFTRTPSLGQYWTNKWSGVWYLDRSTSRKDRSQKDTKRKIVAKHAGNQVADTKSSEMLNVKAYQGISR